MTDDTDSEVRRLRAEVAQLKRERVRVLEMCAGEMPSRKTRAGEAIHRFAMQIRTVLGEGVAT